jgi:hypothetical protein
MLIGQLNDDVKQIFQSIADGSDFEIAVIDSRGRQAKKLPPPPPQIVLVLGSNSPAYQCCSAYNEFFRGFGS